MPRRLSQKSLQSVNADDESFDSQSRNSKQLLLGDGTRGDEPQVFGARRSNVSGGSISVSAVLEAGTSRQRSPGHSPSKRSVRLAKGRRKKKEAPLQWYHFPLLVAGYGLLQGAGDQLWNMGFYFYWRDRVDPGMLQMYTVLLNLPWDVKPVWGLICDAYPPRRKFMLSAAVLGSVSFFCASFCTQVPNKMLAFLFFGSQALSVIDLMLDASVAEQTRDLSEKRSADLVSITTTANILCTAFGGLSKGTSQTHFGSPGQFRMQSSFIFIVLICALCQSSSSIKEDAGASIRKQTISLYRVMPFIWTALLYCFLERALVPNFGSMWTYFLTTKESGPSKKDLLPMPNFNPEWLGFMSFIMSMVAMVLVIFYQKKLVSVPFRRVLIMTHVMQFFCGFADIPMVMRWNLQWGISDKSWVLLSDEIINPLIIRLQLLPFTILVSQYFCPPGLEGSIFALTNAAASIGEDVGKSMGAVIEEKVTSLFPHYVGGLNPNAVAICILIRQACKIIPIFLPIFLLADVKAGEGPSKKFWKLVMSNEKRDLIPTRFNSNI